MKVTKKKNSNRGIDFANDVIQDPNDPNINYIKLTKFREIRDKKEELEESLQSLIKQGGFEDIKQKYDTLLKTSRQDAIEKMYLQNECRRLQKLLDKQK